MTNLIKLGLASLVVLLVMTGCGRSAQILNVPKQDIAKKTTNDKMFRAIQRAGTGLGWIVTKKGNNSAIATLNVRSHQAVAKIDYDGKGYSINYVSSNNLQYSAEEGTIHKNYNGWIQNLNNAIQVQLSTL